MGYKKVPSIKPKIKKSSFKNIIYFSPLGWKLFDEAVKKSIKDYKFTH